MPISKGQIVVGGAAGAAGYAFADDLLDLLPLDDGARTVTGFVGGAALAAGGMLICAKENTMARYGGAIMVGAGAGVALRAVNDYFGFEE